MPRYNVACFLVVATVFLASSPLSCSGGSSGSGGGSTQQQGNSVLGWPFDTTQDTWVIENGYNWNTSNGGLDHGCSKLYESCYELYSFDFQRRGPAGSTARQTVLNPASGDVLDVSAAVNGAGRCVRISIDGHDRYYILICHVDNPMTGHIERGKPLGKVNERLDYGDHIHMTLYYLPPNTDDTVANASKRQAIPFRDPWAIDTCNYRANGSGNQWAGTPVPCGGSSGVSETPTYTPTIVPTPSANPLLACRTVPGFEHDGPAEPVGAAFTVATAPVPPGSVGHLDSVFSTPPGGGHPYSYDFRIVDVCSPGATADGVRAFFAREMPLHGWQKSDYFPYNSDASRACGDPYCWVTYSAPEEADSVVGIAASLESVQQVGAAVTYQIRTADDSV